jgi:integrase
VVEWRHHPLRHSFATLLGQERADLADVSELLGHKSPNTTAHYASVILAKLTAAVKNAASLGRRRRGTVSAAAREEAVASAAIVHVDHVSKHPRGF